MPDSIGVVDIAFNTYDEIFIATDHGPYYSQNGDQWEWLGIDDYPGTIYINDNNNIYVGSTTLYQSIDNGITWDTLAYYSQGGINSIYSSDDVNIYFGTWGGIFRSTDGGTTWIEVLNLYNTEVVTAIAENSEGVLFAGTTSYSGDISPGGLYSSDDGGTTWQLTGLDYHFVSSIVINSNDEIFVGTKGHWLNGDGGIFKSVDDGITWETSYSNILVNDLTLNTYDEIAFCCPMESYPDGGVHFSVDNGGNWNNINNNLPGDYLNGVSLDKNSVLFAIGLYGDLFRTETPVSISMSQSIPSDLFSLYPNPAKNRLNIKVFECSLMYISDLSGKIVKIVNPEINRSIIEINISGLTPSVYFIYFICDDNIIIDRFIKY